MSEQVNTAEEVLAALGGVQTVAGRLGKKYNAVENWRRRGLPPESFWALGQMLKQKGISAPRSLWRQYEFK